MEGDWAPGGGTTSSARRSWRAIRDAAGETDEAVRERGINRSGAMLDVIYLVGTVAFFAAMLAYVRGCEALGRDETIVAETTHER